MNRPSSRIGPAPAAVASIALASIGLAASARADCPPASFNFTGPSVSVSQSAWDTSAVTGPANWPNSNFAQASFDLSAGRAFLSGEGEFAGYAGLIVRDDFTVVGLPPGTEVDVLAELRLAGSLRIWGGHGSAALVEVEFYVADVPAATYRAYDRGPNLYEFNQTLYVPVRVTTGVPFRVAVWLQAGPTVAGQSQAQVEGTWSLNVAEPNARLQSCWGYDQPTPVQVESWGALKDHYR